jgi:hypothetical protein
MFSCSVFCNSQRKGESSDDGAGCAAKQKPGKKRVLESLFCRASSSWNYGETKRNSKRVLTTRKTEEEERKLCVNPRGMHQSYSSFNG